MFWRRKNRPAEPAPGLVELPPDASPEERVRILIAALPDGTVIRPEEIHGLLDHEILAVENDQAAPFGDAYRCFLRLAGDGAGFFLPRMHAFYPHVVGIRDAADTMLRENDVPFHLSGDDRVFTLMPQFGFDFLHGPGPDPEVWSYNSSAADAVPEFRFTRFTDWLQDSIRAHHTIRHRFGST